MKVRVRIYLKHNQVQWHAQYVRDYAHKVPVEVGTEAPTFVKHGRNEVSSDKADNEYYCQGRSEQASKGIGNNEEVENAQDNRYNNESPLDLGVVQAFSHADRNHHKYHIGEKDDVFKDTCNLEGTIDFFLDFIYVI